MQSQIAKADWEKACEELYAKLELRLELFLATHPPAALTHPPAALALDDAIPRCMHREGMKLTGGLSISGTVEEDCVENWCTHLETTLFDHHSQKSDAFYDAMVGCWDTMVVTSCRTQAHRFYYVRCKNCNQYV